MEGFLLADRIRARPGAGLSKHSGKLALGNIQDRCKHAGMRCFQSDRLLPFNVARRAGARCWTDVQALSAFLS